MIQYTRGVHNLHIQIDVIVLYKYIITELLKSFFSYIFQDF